MSVPEPETGLAEGEVKIPAGSSDAGRRILQKLQKDVGVKSFGRIHRTAKALLCSGSYP